MTGVALINARKVYANTEIRKQEYRIVNNTKVLHIEMEMKAEELSFVFIGYYYSDKGGTSQHLAWVLKDQYEDNYSQAIEFLNGFTVIE